MVLGVVQGLTEFLPISSSAHLLIARRVFGWDLAQFGLLFDISCHVGTLLAIVVYFRRKLADMLRSLPFVFNRAPVPAAQLLRRITLATVPIGFVGLVFGDAIVSTLRTPVVVAAALTIGGVVLLKVERKGSQSRDENTLTMPEAFGLGLAQMTALIPGVSRSGAVVAAAMWFGLQRDAAARVAFLLGVPAVLGAAGMEGWIISGQNFLTEELLLFAVGVATSAIVGYFTISYFISFVGRYSLDVFAFYRFGLAGSIAIWLVAS